MLAESQRFTPVMASAETAMIMTRIYDAEVNMAVWQRVNNVRIANYAQTLCNEALALQLRTIIAPTSVSDYLASALPDTTGRDDFVNDVALLSGMFADLFELNHLGLRLSIIDNTMCPRFHTDHLPCRLVTSYMGAGTEWLPEQAVDRHKLAAGAGGLPDHQSGIYSDPAMIEQLQTGDVALLKGEGWHGNRGYGIVHRSPAIEAGDKRLLLTLDFAE